MVEQGQLLFSMENQNKAERAGGGPSIRDKGRSITFRWGGWVVSRELKTELELTKAISKVKLADNYRSCC